MNWKEVLKAHCGTEKLDTEEKKLIGNQKRIDADKDGKITGKDFAMLRDKTNKSEDVAKSPTSIYNRLSNELKQKVKDLVYNQNLSLADAVMKVTRESRQQKHSKWIKTCY